MSVEVARFGMRKCALTHLVPNICDCHVLWIMAVAVCRIGDVCCLLAPAHQPFSFIIWVLVLLKKLVAEMYVHQALKIWVGRY